MPKRLSRALQTDRNRDQVLAAARRVFLAKGYAGATLDAIAEEAGFSKGVVYSQFEGKGDLFLALLDLRIVERAALNEAAVGRRRGARGVQALFRAARRDAANEAGWGLLLLEFRLQAARDPQLNRRYAEAHRRTIAHVAATIERLLRESGETPRDSAKHLATLAVAISSGLLLERAVDPRVLPSAVTSRGCARLLGMKELA